MFACLMMVVVAAVKLPPESLEQALLLHPCLLDGMLEAAAAAVLGPLLQGDHPTRYPGSAAAVLHRAVLGGDNPAILSSSSRSADSMESLLDVSCPWMHWLPKTLAYNPTLMLKVICYVTSFVQPQS